MHVLFPLFFSSRVWAPIARCRVTRDVPNSSVWFISRVCLIFYVQVASLASAAYFKEEFGSGWDSRWVTSDWKKSEGTAGVWKNTAGTFYGDAEADKGMLASLL